jgi:hypothetical protein
MPSPQNHGTAEISKDTRTWGWDLIIKSMSIRRTCVMIPVFRETSARTLQMNQSEEAAPENVILHGGCNDRWALWEFKGATQRGITGAS